MSSDIGGMEVKMMSLALAQARQAGLEGEVPVGAVLVDQRGQVLAASGNNCVSAHDPAGHAEIRVLRQAARVRGNYRLLRTTLFVTLEPCVMCAAAMLHARIERLVFGATDDKAGGVVSQYQIGADCRLNHHFLITGGVLADECGRMLQDFFRKRREK